jgi:hypothetical protein
MTYRRLLQSGVVLASLWTSAPAVASADHEDGVQAMAEAAQAAARLVDQVRTATSPFRRLEAAEAAGYGLFHGCVSGPEGGAMGVHFVNGDLVGDGLLDATRPEALMYQWKDGRPQLVGVEFVVLAEAWNAAHSAPPVLGGQLFTYNPAPNRYGIPAFYALHVWAWQQNPAGVFADWNHKVSCAEYQGDSATSHESH